jgi:hypothetical protein
MRMRAVRYDTSTERQRPVLGGQRKRLGEIAVVVNEAGEFRLLDNVIHEVVQGGHDTASSLPGSQFPENENQAWQDKYDQMYQDDATRVLSQTRIVATEHGGPHADNYGNRPISQQQAAEDDWSH